MTNLTGLTSEEIKDLAEGLILAASDPLAPRDLGYWAPTEDQTRAAVAAVLRALQRSARAKGVGLDFLPLLVELERGSASRP